MPLEKLYHGGNDLEDGLIKLSKKFRDRRLKKKQEEEQMPKQYNSEEPVGFAELNSLPHDPNNDEYAVPGDEPILHSINGHVGVSIDALPKAEDSVPTIITKVMQGVQTEVKKIVQSVKEIATLKLDRNDNGKIERMELEKGAQVVATNVARLLQSFSILATILMTGYGFLKKEFNWIVIVICIALLIFATILISVFKTMNQSNFSNTDKLLQEFNTRYSTLAENTTTKYKTLKDRFIDYKDTAEKEVRTLQQTINSLEKDNASLNSVKDLYGALLKFIQQRHPEENIGVEFINP